MSEHKLGKIYSSISYVIRVPMTDQGCGFHGGPTTKKNFRQHPPDSAKMDVGMQKISIRPR